MQLPASSFFELGVDSPVRLHQVGQDLFVVVVKDRLLVCPVRVLLDPLAIAVPEGVGTLLGRGAHDPDARVQTLHGPGQEAVHGRGFAHARGPQDDETTLRLRIDATRLGELELSVLHVLQFFSAFKSYKPRYC